MAVETQLPIRKNTILYEGKSSNEAVAVALYQGFLPTRDDPSKFVRIWAYRPDEVVATLAKEGNSLVLATTPDYDGPISIFNPTQERLAEFIATGYLALLRGERLQLDRMRIHPADFKANIGDILQIELTDGHQVLGYVSGLEAKSVGLNAVNTLAEDRQFFGRSDPIDTYDLDKIIHYRQLAPTSESIGSNLRVGEPVEATQQGKNPRQYAGYVAHLLSNGRVLLDSFDPVIESHMPKPEQKSHIIRIRIDLLGDTYLEFNPRGLRRLNPNL